MNTKKKDGDFHFTLKSTNKEKPSGFSSSFMALVQLKDFLSVINKYK